MAFSNFKNIAEVQQRFQIRYREAQFIEVGSFDVSSHFYEEFEFYRENMDVYSSEASRCEMVISPILKEIYKRYYEKCSFWIQKSITYNDQLTGTPDYLFSTKSPLGKTVLEKPLLIVVEAKRNDFEQGWGQCLAELVGVQKINDNTDHPVYGIVTDGSLWQFGKLQSDQFIKNQPSYTIDNTAQLLSAVDFLFRSSITV